MQVEYEGERKGKAGRKGMVGEEHLRTKYRHGD